MKRRGYLFVGIALLVLLITVGGCASGVSTEDFQAQISSLNEKIDALTLQLADSESNVAALSTMSAYQLWFYQYYSLGTYVFPDVKSFNKSCGLLIREVNDGDAVTSWNMYLQADKAYYDLLESLPEDTATWTKAQYEQWVELNGARSDFKTIGSASCSIYRTFRAGFKFA